MVKRRLPTVAELRRAVSYDPVTGIMTWKKRTPDMFPKGDRVAQYCIEVKSERETVVMYGCLVDLSGAWGFDGSELFEQPNTHIITFETEDGEPVLDSIKMEQL